MKKLIYALAFCWASVMLISCEKVEPTYVEGKNPDERVREFMQEVRSTLIGAPSGWRVGIATPAGLSFTYYMEFLEGNRVRMYSDFNAPAMVEMQESSYALRNTGIPSLIFDSYNYIHIPADPDPVHNNGSAGTGLNGDFEFSIQRISGDTIVLKGNLRSNEIRMIRANQAEWNAVKNGQWPASRDKIIEYFGSRQNTYVNISVGGQTQMMGVDFVDGRMFEFFGMDNDNILVANARAFLSADEKVDFGHPSYKGVQFRSGYFNASNNFVLRDAAGQEYPVSESPSSIIPLPPFFDHFGYGKRYNYFLFNTGMAVPEFRPIWDAILQESVSEADRVIRDIRVSILPSGQLLVRGYRHAAGTGTGGTVSFARLYFNPVDHPDGSVSYVYTATGTDGNASNSALRTNSDNLVTFLANNRFVWDWRTRAMIQGGLYVVDEQGRRTGISITGTLAND